MRTIAAHTLGCKVNQYDTQAMLELFQQAGFEVVSLEQEAEVYLINTCTVTGTGDRKSLQLIRRLRREHPDAAVIACGCMAQMLGETLFSSGADVVLGTQNRHKVVDLLLEAERSGRKVCAVAPMTGDVPFERLNITGQTDHTRAVIKIQEGCENRCSYCIIPSVRGPVRSRPLEDIRQEISSLARAGFREIVLTGIQISAYGRDLSPKLTLLDVIRLGEAQEGILRIRLGSLEPTLIREEFTAGLAGLSKLCPQFHLALQSGSDSVLARMRRQYNVSRYLQAVDSLREVFPRAALTTDILTGFPGETEAEFLETREMIGKVGFARIHVFPYSPRPGTPAAEMSGQLTAADKETRVRELIAAGKESAVRYLKSWEGQRSSVLPETQTGGQWEGYTPEYTRVLLDRDVSCEAGVPVEVTLYDAASRGMRGKIATSEKKRKEGNIHG